MSWRVIGTLTASAIKAAKSFMFKVPKTSIPIGAVKDILRCGIRFGPNKTVRFVREVGTAVSESGWAVVDATEVAGKVVQVGKCPYYRKLNKLVVSAGSNFKDDLELAQSIAKAINTKLWHQGVEVSIQNMQGKALPVQGIAGPLRFSNPKEEKTWLEEFTVFMRRQVESMMFLPEGALEPRRPQA